MRCVTSLSVAAVLACLASPALAADVTVSDGWFRALPAGLPAGGYFTLHNNGAADASLTGAASSACGMIMLHMSMSMGGTSSMMDVESVTIPAHGEVAFKPGGYHLMCMKPGAAMAPGGQVRVKLDFADGTKAAATFAVKDAKGQ